ncbi:PAS domain-containing protein [Rhizobium leguminosarum]|uniref:PAS domain-containing protein n=1 Tax=Rhizobium leguminosarum TaxID=384 RepID=UPI000FEE280F|nr:PAS domain-containing protein [Rhizobium leguminosarum]RWY79065.1 PAS domain-containing protein [Rhizobium leguminosarum]
MAENQSEQDARLAGDRLLAEHASDDPFAAAFKHTRMPMIITDPSQHDNPIIFSNAAFSKLTGYTPEELVGKNCRLLQGPDTDPSAVTKLRKAIDSEDSISVDLLNYRKDGSTFWNALYVSPARDSSGKVKYFFASQLDFTHIKNREIELAEARGNAEAEVLTRTRELESALESKTLLVHEVDHRVKNNLLTVASLLKLKTRTSTRDFAKHALDSVLERIEALSMVQRKLFTTDDVGNFDVAEFARELAVDLVSASGRPDIKLEFDLSPVLVPAPKASPLALIVNELISDAMRRGLRDGGGLISVTVKRLNGHFLVEVSDDVEPVAVDPEEDSYSKLILQASAKQLGASVETSRTEKRTTVRVELLVK